jgi:hypothetical protein
MQVYIRNWQKRACDATALELAKQNLKRSFRVVGLSKRFHESLRLMIAAFGWKVPSYQNRKVAKVRPLVDPQLAQIIREHNTSGCGTL